MMFFKRTLHQISSFYLPILMLNKPFYHEWSSSSPMPFHKDMDAFWLADAACMLLFIRSHFDYFFVNNHIALSMLTSYPCTKGLMQLII